MEKHFIRMDENNPLVQILIKNELWREIISLSNADKDINVQIRPHSLNVYYKMNSLLKIDLKGKDRLQYSLNYKFVPLIKKIKTKDYVTLIANGRQLDAPEPSDQYQYEFICKDILNKGNFDILKEQISLSATKEKEYQSTLIYKNRNTIIDAEVAFNEAEENDRLEDSKEVSGERTRIDLLNYDKNINKIVAIELKTLFDGRLYNGEIKEQLRGYSSFLTKKEKDIQKAYAGAIRAKKTLGLLGPNSQLAEIDFNEVKIENKPLLAVICYNQDLIDVFRKKIEDAVKGVAYGVFFFGKSGDLNIRCSKNRTIF